MIRICISEELWNLSRTDGGALDGPEYVNE
jgi:hypothetical protein